jgi:hypothetical protein
MTCERGAASSAPCTQDGAAQLTEVSRILDAEHTDFGEAVREFWTIVARKLDAGCVTDIGRCALGARLS